MDATKAQTFEGFAMEWLDSCAVFPDQAAGIVATAKANKEMWALADMWSKPTEGYPVSVKAAFLLNIKLAAKEWAAANLPNAFWVGMMD